MTHSEDTGWIWQILAQLESPDAGLVRDLLEHLARLRGAGRDELLRLAEPKHPPTSDDVVNLEVLRQRAASFSRLREA